jgi:TonB family protein
MDGAAAHHAEVAAEPVATAPAAADAQRSENAPTSDAAATNRPSELARATRPAADSVPSLGEFTVAVRSAKAKAAVASAAALVANSLMPAAMTIAPAPVTGTPALRDYLRQEAADFELEEGAKPLSGTVRLRFVVEPDGKLSNLQVVRSLRADYDEEALRMVCEGPAWRPGIAGDRRTALPAEVTVSF